MARRTELKGIANSFNSSFVSRNNDYNGYRSVGLLKLYAIERGLTSVRFTFLPHNSDDSFVLIKDITQPYSRLFIHLLEKQQIPAAWVKEVSIMIDFATQDKADRSVISPSSGQLFKSLCQIVDDQHRLYSSAVYGQCLLHSAARELRSTRVDSYKQYW